MKKALALLLASVLLTGMTACGGSEAEVDTDIQETAEESAEAPAEIATPEEIAADFSRGVIDGQVYTSEFAGITYTAPEGFRYYDDSEIAAIYGLTEEMLGEAAADSVVYDVYCVDSAGNNISINYENLSGIYGELLDAKAYLTLSESGVKTAFADMEDVELISTAVETVDAAGTTWDCLSVELNMNGAHIYEKILAKDASGYMAIITATSADLEMLTTILSGLVNM